MERRAGGTSPPSRARAMALPPRAIAARGVADWFHFHGRARGRGANEGSETRGGHDWRARRGNLRRARARRGDGTRTKSEGANGSSRSSSSSDGGSKKIGGDGGFGGLWDKAKALTKNVTEKGGEWATTTQNAVTKQVNEKVKLMQPQMEVAVDYFGPTTRQLKELTKPLVEPVRKEWMNLKPETRRVMKGGFWGALFGNIVLGWPARAERKQLRRKIEAMQLERTKMLVDDFSLEREVLALNAENRRLEKRTLRAEMALNAIKRRLGEYVVAPKDESNYSDPNLSGILPGAPWANDLLDSVGQRINNLPEAQAKKTHGAKKTDVPAPKKANPVTSSVASRGPDE